MPRNACTPCIDWSVVQVAEGRRITSSALFLFREYTPMLSDLEPDKCAKSSVLDLARSKSFRKEASRGPWCLYHLKGNPANISNSQHLLSICKFHFLFDLGQRGLGSLLCHPTHDLLAMTSGCPGPPENRFLSIGIFFVGHSLGFSASQWVFHN